MPGTLGLARYASGGRRSCQGPALGCTSLRQLLVLSGSDGLVTASPIPLAAERVLVSATEPVADVCTNWNMSGGPFDPSRQSLCTPWQPPALVERKSENVREIEREHYRLWR